MGNPPKGAMSTPYGSNNNAYSEFAKDALDAMNRSGSEAWGPYGDKPKKNTHLPKSEQDELEKIEQAKIAAQKLQEEIKQQQLNIQQLLSAEKEKMRLELELEYQKKLNTELSKLIKENNKTTDKLILG